MENEWLKYKNTDLLIDFFDNEQDSIYERICNKDQLIDKEKSTERIKNHIAKTQYLKHGITFADILKHKKHLPSQITNDTRKTFISNVNNKKMTGASFFEYQQCIEIKIRNDNILKNRENLLLL